LLQNAADLLLRYRWETLKKLIEGVIMFKVFEKGFDWNTRPFEYGRATQNLRINGDKLIQLHAENVQRSEFWGNVSLHSAIQNPPPA